MKKTELIKIIKECHIEILKEDSDNFAYTMYKLEDKLQAGDPQIWNNYEAETGDLWRELGVENWAGACIKDYDACVTYRQKLENLVRDISENKRLKKVLKEQIKIILKDTKYGIKR